jgi:hypothetical protein
MCDSRHVLVTIAAIWIIVLLSIPAVLALWNGIKPRR